MNNIDKLRQLGVLGDVRQRVGANDENDDSKDYIINGFNNSELVGCWCGWNLGDGEHWFAMKELYDDLNVIDENN